MKKLIILTLIAGFMNGCMVKRIFKGGIKGHGGGHNTPATMRR